MKAGIIHRSLAKATVAATRIICILRPYLGPQVISVAIAVPSQEEVDRAIDVLQTSDNWIHRLLNQIGQSRVCDVFLLLRTESIMRMVVSVATDKAVWNAVMANKEVSALLNSFSRFASIGEEKAKGKGEKRDWITLLFEWVQGIGNAIIHDFIERLNSFIDKASGTSKKNKNQQHASSSPEELNFILRATYFLSCFVFLIIFVTRANE